MQNDPYVSSIQNTSAIKLLIDQVHVLTDRIDSLELNFTELEDIVTSSNRSTIRRDLLNEKILEYMRKYPGMKFMANSIAVNIQEDNSKVGTRLKSMVSRGVVERVKDEGKVSVYFLKESSTEDPPKSS